LDRSSIISLLVGIYLTCVIISNAKGEKRLGIEIYTVPNVNPARRGLGGCR